MVVRLAAESVYSGVGVRRGVARAGWNLGNFGLGWAESQTVGSAPDENRFTVSRTGEDECTIGAVFEIKKGIP
jgi:hypothetical protein